MSVQITPEEIDFDVNVAADIARLRRAKAEISELQEQADILTERIKAALGDSTIGLVNGAPVVRWTFVESTRFDSKKARQILKPEIVELLETTTQSRRFTILDSGEQW